MNFYLRLSSLLVLLIAGAVMGWPGRAWPTATLVVTTTADSDDGLCDGDCSLREAIKAANSTAGADTITFVLPVSSTIVLAGAQLPVITRTLTIDGSTAVSLTISAAQQSRIFEIALGTAVTMTHLTLREGNAFTNGGDNCPLRCGGAIYNRGTLVLGYMTMLDNQARSGGAIYNWSGDLLLDHSTVANNVGYEGQSGGGGGINNTGGYVTIRNSTITGNVSIFGGGLSNWPTTMILQNVTLSGNTTVTDNSTGAAIINEGTLYLDHSTVTGNLGIFGALMNEGTLHFSNTLIGVNPVITIQCYNVGSIATNVNNLVQDGSCSPAVTGYPFLEDLADNGGPTWTHALLPDSPAIDAGAAEACLPQDQRGVKRPLDGDNDGTAECDIGAFEAGPTPTPTPSPTPKATPSPTPTATPLAETAPAVYLPVIPVK